MMGGHADVAAAQYSVNDDGNSPLLSAARPTSSEVAGHADEWSLDYDAQNGFPETPERSRLGWRDFSVDVYSTEADATEVLQNVIEEIRVSILETFISVSLLFFKYE